MTSPLQQQQKRDDDDSKPSRGNAADVLENLITSAYLEANGPWRLAESLHDFLILGSVPAISKLFSREHSDQEIVRSALKKRSEWGKLALVVLLGMTHSGPKKLMSGCRAK